MMTADISQESKGIGLGQQWKDIMKSEVICQNKCPWETSGVTGGISSNMFNVSMLV